MSSISIIGTEGDQAIQIIKQTCEKKPGSNEPSLFMEITALEHPNLNLSDIIVTRKTLINLEKKTAGKHRKAFPLFNH